MSFCEYMKTLTSSL